MRILICGMNFSPELIGIGKYTGEMAQWLTVRGHNVRVVTAPPYYPHWSIPAPYAGYFYARETWHVEADSGSSVPCDGHRPGTLEVIRCPLWVPQAPRGFRRVLHLASFAAASFPAMLCQIAWNPDVVLLIVPTLFCSAQTLLVSRVTGARSWLHVQDFEVDAAFQLGQLSSPLALRIGTVLESWLIRGFDRVSTISDRMIDRLAKKKVDASRQVLFPNWVDTRAIYPLPHPSPMRHKFGIPDDSVVALYSGNMGEKQGLDLLVRIAERLKNYDLLRFVFCGQGSRRQELINAAKALPNVTFLPLQREDRLNDLLNLADIHLLPQRADAADLVMPSKLTGMLASGRPVVATAREGTQIAAVVRGRGLVVPPEDPDAMAAAILTLADDRNLRRRMGEEGRLHAVRFLHRDAILERFERSLFEVCGMRRGLQEAGFPTT